MSWKGQAFSGLGEDQAVWKHTTSYAGEIIGYWEGACGWILVHLWEPDSSPDLTETENLSLLPVFLDRFQWKQLWKLAVKCAQLSKVAIHCTYAFCHRKGTAHDACLYIWFYLWLEGLKQSQPLLGVDKSWNVWKSLCLLSLSCILNEAWYQVLRSRKLPKSRETLCDTSPLWTHNFVLTFSTKGEVNDEIQKPKRLSGSYRIYLNPHFKPHSFIIPLKASCRTFVGIGTCPSNASRSHNLVPARHLLNHFFDIHMIRKCF